ncbi:MAG: DUF975 family protein [Clostridia bacterium]|nr:DUF975 family protein [Clostridia bacterium]
MNNNPYQPYDPAVPDFEPIVKNAAYYRRVARQKLKSVFGVALVVVLLASLLGGIPGGGVSFSTGSSGGEVNFEFDPEAFQNMTFESFAQMLFGEQIGADRAVTLLTVMIAVLGFSVVISYLINLFVGSPITLGLQRFFLNVIDGENVNVGVLFSYFKKAYWKSIGLRILHSLILTLASLPLLLLMGGVVVAMFLTENVTMVYGVFALAMAACIPFSLLAMVIEYRYHYCFMILAEYPEMRAVDALRNSAQIMKGNKWRLFCLDISFIGWILLATFCTCGIGVFVLTPYMYAADAAFYDDITNRQAAKETEFPSVNPDDYIGQQEF